ncbi:MAG: PAS domain S-box protein, partial [Steroidobacter sp.]
DDSLLGQAPAYVIHLIPQSSPLMSPASRLRSSSDLTAALDALNHATLIVEASAPERPILYVNPAFAELTGYAPQEVLERSLMLLAGRESDPIVQQDLRDALAAARPFTAEWIVHRKDGAPVWSRVSLRPMELAGAARIIITLEDISAFKRARESVRASEARLAVAMEASELSMWDWNVERDEVYYNDRWRESLGVEPRKLVERAALSDRLMLPANDPALLERFEQCFRGATPRFEAEYPLTTASGEPKWFLAHVTVVRRAPDGKAQRVIGVLRDISLRKRDQKEALDVERRWERAVRGTSDGLYDWDLLTGYVWYATRFREIVGYSGQGFPDTFQAFQNVLHPDDRTLVLGKIRAHLENRGRLDIRCRIATRGGAVIWCRLRGEAERDAAGRPLRLSGALSDISAQIDAEEALNRSQDFYGTILDSLPLFVAFADRDERVVYANRMFQDFFAAPLATSRGRIINDLIGADRYAVIGPYMGEALLGKTVEGQGRFRDASGRAFDLDAAFIPHRDESGEVQGCFVVARDMTEKRQLEAELRQSQKMEAVGRLTGGIAHDFNNLLSVIVGNMQLLARSLRESPRLLRQSETALKAAMRGAELTRRLLAFARQQVLEPKNLNLNEMIGGMYELLSRTLSRDIEIRQQLDPDAWSAKVDPGQLENAVLNLVINARDAMPDGGLITIATRNVTLDERQSREEAMAPGEYSMLSVADTGTGMTPDIVKRAIEPFFTTKDVGKGSGLGLSMVYGFVRQSGGYVHIASAPGRGATVHLYFPRTLSCAESASLNPDVTADLPRGAETLLVVEDNVEVRMTAVEILRTLGYRVFEASNGRQAHERFMQHPDIALVFSDIMLPGGLLGLQLVQKLREHRPDLKVLMTSGFSESGIMSRGVLDGSIGLLPKPYRVEDLARQIRARLDSCEENKRGQA